MEKLGLQRKVVGLVVDGTLGLEDSSPVSNRPAAWGIDLRNFMLYSHVFIFSLPSAKLEVVCHFIDGRVDFITVSVCFPNHNLSLCITWLHCSS